MSLKRVYARLRRAMAKSGVIVSPRISLRSCGLLPFLAPPEKVARALEIGRCVDAERHAVDDRCVDAHARFERAPLLEFFALLERRGRQRHEALERAAAKGIK